MLGIPDDMINDSPVPCGFKVGDQVVFTNDYGVSFDLVVRGFAADPELHGGRYVYLFKSSWWFPVDVEALKARQEGVR